MARRAVKEPSTNNYVLSDPSLLLQVLVSGTAVIKNNILGKNVLKQLTY